MPPVASVEFPWRGRESLVRNRAKALSIEEGNARQAMRGLGVR